jgi:hypothetical protein
MVFCSECGDEFEEVEYRAIDIDGENFCSSECEDKWNDAEEFAGVYFEGMHGGAPVF